MKLDIGGHRFSTTRTTLTAIPGSIFDAMLSGQSPLVKDEEDGSYFIDRDGRHFHILLAFLRAPANFVAPLDGMTCKELLRESEYYKINMSSVLEALTNDAYSESRHTLFSSATPSVLHSNSIITIILNLALFALVGTGSARSLIRVPGMWGWSTWEWGWSI